MVADDATLMRLMRLSQQGDNQAYSVLLCECQLWLKRYYARRVPPHHLDDLVQDTLLSVHRKGASYDPARPFLPWLAAVARYRWVDHLRKVSRAKECEFSDEIAATSDEPAMTARISIERLLGLLPVKQARAIELVKIEGHSVSEASEQTGQSEALIKVNIHRGLKRLASMIEKV